MATSPLKAAAQARKARKAAKSKMSSVDKTRNKTSKAMQAASTGNTKPLDNLLNKAKRAANKAAKAGANTTTGGFSFKGSGRSAAYRGAAGKAIRGGASVLAAHRAGLSADGTNKIRAANGDMGNS